MNRNLAAQLFGTEIIYSKSEVIIEKKIDAIQSEENVIRTILPPQKEAEPIKSSFKNRLIILVSSFDEIEKELLTNILKACTLTLSDIVLIDFSKEKDFNFQNIFGNQNTLVSFGVGLQKMGFNLNLVPYQIKITTENRFLLSDGLLQLSNNQLLKKNLWIALQKLLSPL